MRTYYIVVEHNNPPGRAHGGLTSLSSSDFLCWENLFQADCKHVN